ncbi:ribosomal protection tetracycline resistance protein [Nonomuraea maritima]|uniref:Ribosomal protection tetracycline resistance protein n=1 Tax=Nonomuraea maritima TaxID=683260 RepID=A0A1G9CXA3_9ACTN|nr:TetM/TetW/TetO/TetS family tetracycline resistance ribosomal protection protein [Nonomuraea maritima]SDK56035.1 ribosomal protection tetracycline resistance protein [Nonomuraea maritima]
MNILNIGILAHVDAGKTSLTERLLFETGVTARLGSVDAGTTQTDTDAIERRRGITIRSAVASFTLGDLQVNLVDTPGHADFVAEVERALGVLDGAVLVLSAVEGVQPHTRVLMRTLRRLRLPTLIFVNKIDRMGAQEGELLAGIRRRLAPSCVPLNTVDGIGGPGAVTRPVVGLRETAALREAAELHSAELLEAAEVLAEHDDGLLELLVDGVPPSPGQVRAALARQCAAGVAYPVVFGSAITGEGVGELLDAVASLLPSVALPGPGKDGVASPSVSRPGPAEEVRGTVFAIERAASGEKAALLRVRGGELGPRERLVFHRSLPGGAHTYEGRLTAIEVAGAPDRQRAMTGDIVKLWGVPGIRVGDHLGGPPPVGSHFAAPSLETVVRPRVPGQEPRLHAALLALAEQDPLIGTRTTAAGETSVLLYGEVQKEVIAETLAAEFGVEADFEPSRPVYFERPAGTGEAVEEILRHGPNPFMATVGLRVEPGPRGSGVGYRLEVDLGSLPLAFHRAIEESVRLALGEGPHGWPVTDVLVTVTRTGYAAPVTVAADFRGRTPIVVMEALRRAGTVVYEPCHRFELEAPRESLGPVTASLTELRGQLCDTRQAGEGWVLTGEIPAAVVHVMEGRLPGLTRGEGGWWSEPAGDRPVRSPVTRRHSVHTSH